MFKFSFFLTGGGVGGVNQKYYYYQILYNQFTISIIDRVGEKELYLARFVTWTMLVVRGSLMWINSSLNTGPRPTTASQTRKRNNYQKNIHLNALRSVLNVIIIFVSVYVFICLCSIIITCASIEFFKCTLIVHASQTVNKWF